MALVHTERRDNIIKSFKQADIYISPGETEDGKLYVRSLLDITVGIWQMEDTLDSDEEGCIWLWVELILVHDVVLVSIILFTLTPA